MTDQNFGDDEPWRRWGCDGGVSPVGSETRWRRWTAAISRFLKALTLGVAGLAIDAPPSFTQDFEAAEKTFKKCKACHDIGEGAKKKVGPVLNGLDGRIAASLEGFNYSKVFRKAGQDGLVWNRENLDAFLRKPREFIKGTRMNYAGLKDDEERSNLVLWLLHFSPDGSELAKSENQGKLLGEIAAAMEGDPAYGKYLSGECVTCHQLSGGDSSIPAITGWPKENFIHALYEYKTKVRKNPVMQTVTGRLEDEEMAALAAYFGSIPAQ